MHMTYVSARTGFSSHVSSSLCKYMFHLKFVSL